MRLSTPLFFALASLTAICQPVFGQSASAGASADPLVLDGHLQRHSVSPLSASQVVRFENLIPGETYDLVISGNAALDACFPQAQSIDVETIDQSFSSDVQLLQFKATAQTHDFSFQYGCEWAADAPPQHIISLVCKTCVKKTWKEYVESMSATLVVEPGIGAEELIRETLIGGNCFDVTNVTYTGNTGQIGRFGGGLTNIGFNKGMLMATGDISVAVGPNNSDNASAGFGNGTPDADLSQLSGSGSIFDMANIEFDFTPTESPLTFEYVFGSEEYCEYVGSQFNDAFGFFISGPGINGPFGGAENIAQIGGAYVAINNVNHQSNSGLYVNNTPPGGILCGQNGSFAPGVNEVQFDGYTRRLLAIANVQPCETYHIKLKIADVGDGIYDSGVFIKEGSFGGGGNATADFIVNGDPDVDLVYESCGTVTLVFDRVGGNLNTPLPLSYTIGGTATPGVDYTGIPPVVVIPAGFDTYEVTVNILNDAILEGQETIVITMANPCSCLNPEETLIIEDLPKLEAMADTVVICGAGTGTINAIPQGGVGPYSYQWSTGDTQESISPFVGVSTNYRVTITDDCGKTSVATGRIIVSPLPNAQLLPPAPQLCDGQEGVLNINFNGTGPFTIEYNLNGDAQNPITGIYDDPYQLPISEIGLYQITSVTDSLGCVGPGQGAILVQESTLNLTGVASNIPCSGGNSGSINTTVVGGQGPYNYTWTGPQNIANIPDPVGLGAGTYRVTVTDGFGCTDTLLFNILAPSPIIPSIDTTTLANCLNPSGGAIDISVAGGTPNYLYNWSTGDTIQDPQNLAPGNYQVTITDQNNCTATATATVDGDFTEPIVVTGLADELTCVVNSVQLDGTGSSSGPQFTYQWSASPGNIVSGGNTLNPVVDQSGNYTLVVTNNNNGCTNDDQVQVFSDQILPTAEAGPIQTITCANGTPQLNGAGSSNGPEYSYQWTAAQGGTILNGDSTLNPEVGSTGLYTILVTNTQNGCTRTDSVLVNINTQPPNANAAPPAILTCTANSVTLDGTPSTPNGQLNYAWSTVNGVIQSGQNTANPVVTAAGDYTLIVTNTTNGCMDTTSVTVVPDNSIPTVTAQAQGILTCAIDEITINANGTTTGPDITYQWSTGNGQIVSGANSLTPVVGAPGQYTLLVTNTSNNCTATFNIEVDADYAPPTANAGADLILNCTTPTINLDGAGSSTGIGFTYAWTGPGIVSGANSPNPLVNASGVYEILVTNTSNGCTAIDQVEVLDDATAPSTAVATPGILNCTVNQITLDGSASSTGAEYVPVWSGPGIVSGDTSLTPLVNQPGNYTLLITNVNNGCTAQQIITVNQDITAPPADAGPDDILNCFDPQLSIGGPGNPSGPNYSFAWTGPGIVSGANSPLPTVNQPGAYNLVVTNQDNGCTATDAVNITDDFVNPTINAGPTFELTCTEPTFTLGATGSSGAGFSYQWTSVGGSFVGPSNILAPTVNSDGTYNVTVTNTTNGCTATSSVVITQSADIPTVVAADPSILTCAVTNIQLDATGTDTGPTITYGWTAGPGANIVSGGASLTPTVNAPGTYTLLVSNSANQCTASVNVVVDQNITPPNISAGPTVVVNCYEPSVQLQGSVNGASTYTYAWNALNNGNILSGANSLNPVVDAAGTYQLTVTDTQNGCSSVQQTTATQDQTPPAVNIAAPETLTCAVAQINLDASGSATGNMDYAWSTTNGNFVDTSNPLQPAVDQPGGYQLLITNLDNGCTASLSVEVPQDIAAPAAEAGQQATLTCAVTTLDLNGQGSSTGNEFTYLWSTLNGQILSGQNSLTPNIGQPGVYSLTVLNNANGCSSYDSVLINQNIVAPDILLASPDLLTCKDPQIVLNGSGSQSGGAISYSWTTANGNILAGANSPQATVNQPGAYTFTVLDNNNGCSSTETVNVGQDVNLPSAEAGPGFLLTCSVTEVALVGGGSTGAQFSYNWTTLDGQIVSGANSLSPVVSESGVYTLTVLDTENGCSQTDNVFVDQEANVPTNFVAQLLPPSCLDNDGVITFTQVNGGVEPFLYSINGGQDYFPTLEFGAIEPGTYTLWIQDANGCEFQKPLIVPKAPDPLISVQPEIYISLGESANLNAQLPPGYPLALVDTILWEPLDNLSFDGNSVFDLLNPAATPFRTTEYKVTLISGEGCTAEDRVLVRVDREPKIYIPNAFSPWNSDGENDIVYIFAAGEQVREIQSFRIFDRWGEMVFEDFNFQPNDPAHGWDGRFKGQMLTPAVFVYVAEVVLIDGRIILFKGDITIVR